MVDPVYQEDVVRIWIIFEKGTSSKSACSSRIQWD